MRKIIVVAYNQDWPERFKAEKLLLKDALGEAFVDIHHIGSTAVEGLSAKPIIDILLEVNDLLRLDGFNSKMKALGYEPKGEFGIPGRRYFQKGGDARSHHIHAFLAGDENVKRHLAFRDYLRKNAAVALEYAQLKKKVASKCDNDIAKYCEGKNLFIKQHEAIALMDQCI